MQLELLSPAKNLECGISAINSGADAVYIGAPRFGARAAAGNSVHDIEELCQYAHKFDAKVYVTVNTLLYDSELDDAVALCIEVIEAGADAILVQDIRLIEALQGKKITVHASTQTDNRTIERVKNLAAMGIKRVVLARELSINEIATIHQAVPEVELEVFVHGALCVSYSGRCYASEYCFNRSANRGECAQFCRLPFTLKDDKGTVISRDAKGNTIGRHLLSLKDMAQLRNIEQLVHAGAVSFKIEGRLKDSDYVKNVTAAYSNALNALCDKDPIKFQRASMGRCTYSFIPNVAKSFNRGFTQYFAECREEELVNWFTPKAIGEYVGRVKEIRGNRFSVSSLESFSNGDGLCFISNGVLIGFRINKAEGNHLYPLKMPRELAPGTPLYRNHDQTFSTLLCKASCDRRIKLTMSFNVTHDTISLTLTDEHGNISSTSLPYNYQQSKNNQEDNIRRQLTKLGSTIYTCSELIIHYSDDAPSPFIPSSQLTELRRLAVDAIPARMPSHATFTKKLSDLHLINKGPTDGVLMHCRYCLRNELGYCTRSGRKAPWTEPLSLHLDDGQSFHLKFNCKDCEMYVTL